MDVEIEKIPAGEAEKLLIRCHEITEEIREIADFAKSRQGRLSGVLEEKQYEIAFSDIYYIESLTGELFFIQMTRYTKLHIVYMSWRTCFGRSGF